MQKSVKMFASQHLWLTPTPSYSGGRDLENCGSKPALPRLVSLEIVQDTLS
jgi:hypothetical protein